MASKRIDELGTATILGSDLLPVYDLSGSVTVKSLVSEVFFTGAVQPAASSGVGVDMTIKAQDAQSGSGGNLILTPGEQVTSGSDGVVAVQFPGGTSSQRLQIFHDGTDVNFRNVAGTSSNSSLKIGTAGSAMGVNITGQLTVSVAVASAGNYSITAFGVYVGHSSTNVMFNNGFMTTVSHLQLTAGTTRLSANVTNATVTMANLTGLSQTFLAGRKYFGKLVLYVANSTAADGIKIDFDGGTATMTSFVAHALIHDSAALVTSSRTTAIATDITGATITGDSIVEVNFSFVVNAGGTVIPRVACNAATTGTLTVLLGSSMQTRDCP